MTRDELFDKILELLKGPENGYLDYLQTLVDISGDYLNIEELKELAKSNPSKIARNLIEEGIVDERYFTDSDPVEAWKKKHPGKMTFKEWLEKKYKWDIFTFSEKQKGLKNAIHREYLGYLEPEEGEVMEDDLKLLKDKDSEIITEGNLTDYIWGYRLSKDILKPNGEEGYAWIEIDMKNCFEDLEWEYDEGTSVPGIYGRSSVVYEHSGSYAVLKDDKNIEIILTDEDNNIYSKEDFAKRLDISISNLDTLIEECKKITIEDFEEMVTDKGYDYYFGDSVKLKDQKIGDIIKETSKGYVIYSEKGKRLSKAYKTRKEAEDRLKEIEMFKHMKKDSLYKGYDIEYKGDLYQIWIDKKDGDRKIAGDFPSLEEAHEWIDNQQKENNSIRKEEKIHYYDVYYTDYANDQTMVEQRVPAKSAEDAKRKVKRMYGKAIYGYPHDAILVDCVKKVNDSMLEEVKNFLEKYLIKKDDPNNKLGKTHIRPLRNEERLPKGVYHKAATDVSGIIHYKDGDYYWYIDNDENIHVEKHINDSLDKRFICESYFDIKGHALEDKIETNDIEKGKEWILNKSNKGFITRIIDKKTGEVWPFEIIEDPYELENIVPYNEDLEELNIEERKNDNEYSLWIVQWYDEKGNKHSIEFDSKEDAEDVISNHKDDNEYNDFKIIEQNRTYEDSIRDELNTEQKKDNIALLYDFVPNYEEIEKILIKNKADFEKGEEIFDGMKDEDIKKAYIEVREWLKKEIIKDQEKWMKDQKSRDIIDKFEIHFGIIDSVKLIQKEELKNKIETILKKYIKKLGYEESDIDDYAAIDIENFKNNEGDTGIHIQIRNDLVGYYNPDESPYFERTVEEMIKELDKIVDPGYFEPYSNYVWDAYMFDINIKDSIQDENEKHIVKFITYDQYRGLTGDVELEEDLHIEEEYESMEEAKKASEQNSYGKRGQYVEVYLDGKYIRGYDVYEKEE